MTIVQSRLKNGELILGGVVVGQGAESFACQASSVMITPSYDDDGDDIETLCGDQIRAGKIESWTLNGTSVQDFDNPQGFLAYCYSHAMETVAFMWQPNKTGAPTWTGQCIVVALEEGGDVNAQLTTDWEFPIVGRPTRTPATPASADATTEPEPEPVPA